MFAKFLKQIFPRRNNYIHQVNQKEKGLIFEIQNKKLTYLLEDKLASIALTCCEIEEKKIPGLMLEAGCALGGSAILIAHIKKKNRPFYIYDVFGIIPPPTSEDGKDVQKRYETISAGKSKGLGGD